MRRRFNPYVSCPSCGTGNRDTRETCHKCGFELKVSASPMFGTKTKAWSKPGYLTRNPCGCRGKCKCGVNCNCTLYKKNPGCGCQIDWRQTNPITESATRRIIELAQELQSQINNSQKGWPTKLLTSIKNRISSMVHDIQGTEPADNFNIRFTNKALIGLIISYAGELEEMGVDGDAEQELDVIANKLEELIDQPRRNPWKPSNWHKMSSLEKIDWLEHEIRKGEHQLVYELNVWRNRVGKDPVTLEEVLSRRTRNPLRRWTQQPRTWDNRRQFRRNGGG